MGKTLAPIINASKYILAKEDENDEFLKWCGTQHDMVLGLYEWLSKHKDIKISKLEVNKSILDEKIRTLIIYDVRIFTRGSDDTLYQNSKELRDRVPRGLTLMYIETIAGTIAWSCPLFALKKFTGGLGDEDDDATNDDEKKWEDFFLKPYSQAKKIIITSKENGSAAHLSCFNLFGAFYWLGGSKNNHILVKDSQDLSCYCDNEQRFTFAKRIMKSAITTTCNDKLANFLTSTHYTAIFEFCDPEDMHIEFLDFDIPELRFITFSSITYASENGFDNAKSLCVSPLEPLTQAIDLGLVPIQYNVVNIDDSVDVDCILNEIRTELKVEGKVLYFVDEENCVMGLIKKKAIWYVVIRALREKVKAYLQIGKKRLEKDKQEQEYRNCKEKLDRTITQRLNAIQKWMKYSDGTREKWAVLCLTFNLYFCEKMICDSEKTTSLFTKKYPLLWLKFLQETNSADDFEIEFR